MSSTEYVTIDIPDLLNSPYSIIQVELNGTLYYVEFSWNIRVNRAYLSLYLKKDEEIIYLIKNTCLIRGRKLSQYILNENWGGDLYFARVFGSTETDYRIDNIHEYFCLQYFAPEEK